MIRTARCYEGFPDILENYELDVILLIPLFLYDSVVCEDMEHKISTAIALVHPQGHTVRLHPQPLTGKRRHQKFYPFEVSYKHVGSRVLS